MLIKKNNFIKKFKYTILLMGVVLSLITIAKVKIKYYSTGIVMFSAFIVLWSILPYIIYVLVASRVKNKTKTVSAGMLLLGVDISFHIYIFFFPGSSTDAISLLFLPFWLIILVIPIGILLGGLIDKVIYIAKVKGYK